MARQLGRLFVRNHARRYLPGWTPPVRHPILTASGDYPPNRHDVEEAEMARRRGPAELATYAELLDELRRLAFLCGLSHAELARRDPTGVLRRSTVGAVLRGELSASLEIVIGIVRACGVHGGAVDDWTVDWNRVGRPYCDDVDRRRKWHARGYARSRRSQ